MDFLDPILLIKVLGPIGVIAMVFIESGLFFGFFFPGDSLLFTAGLLAASGYFSFAFIFFGCAIAAASGGMFGYFFGMYVGPAIFKREDSFFFHKKHLDEANRFFATHGPKAILIARFLPVVRTFTPILAGVGRMKYSVFVFYNLLGAFVWSVLLVGGGFYLGRLVPDIEKYIFPIILLIIFASFLPAISGFIKKRRVSD